MPSYAYGVYETITQNTTSDLIMFFLILALVAIPLISLFIRKAEKKQEQEREKNLIEVIRKNSTVIESLKITLENSSDTTRSAIERIHTRIDGVNALLGNVASDVTKVKIKIDTHFNNNRGGAEGKL